MRKRTTYTILDSRFYSCIAFSADRDGDICCQYESAYFPAPYYFFSSIIFYAEKCTGYTNSLTRITSCFAASAGLNGVTSLILRGSNTKIGFSCRSSNFCNFTPRIHQKRSQKVRNPKFSWGRACLQTPLAGTVWYIYHAGIPVCCDAWPRFCFTVTKLYKGHLTVVSLWMQLLILVAQSS